MRIVFWAGFWVFLADQLSKYLVVHFLDLQALKEIDVIPGFVAFHMAWNDGINFGLLSQGNTNGRWILIGIALVICAGVLFWVHRERPRRIGLIAAGFLVGGALGNVVDRLLYGAVADFMNVSCCGIVNPYAFNIADVAIFVGAVMLVFLPAEKGT
ncbi:signal peptidase II [Pseudooceanicola algae]|uniref:Lipoprotein signal peptidase n=1 Tax=Pseudooceanicola algae TaxID=1537215 RepID=A0A418SG47_9RHOB|nr:signal peptidase II [Pseudooceanicola algae]QPM91646.1 Lipoprotein signal peptidase [Pseudooceanicola algae]